MALKFVFATSTRADWGLLSPLAHELRNQGCDITVIATNMHLLHECGYTINEIINDGFDPLKVKTPNNATPAQTTAAVLSGFDTILRNNACDAIIILGDRYEMVGVAQAAVLNGVPIIHIAGGTVSEGAFDDCFRHAITKMAYLHLTETDQNAQKIIQMGENPEMVITTGAIGIHNILNTPLWNRKQLEDSIQFPLGNNTLLVTLHAATLSPVSLSQQYQNLFDALDNAAADKKILFTYPNNDVDTSEAIKLLHDYADSNPGRVKIIPSLGHTRYLSALRYVEAVVGNSSSGLVEVPSMGIPTLDIGCRQDGRSHGPSVIRCGTDTSQIIAGLKKILSPELKLIAAQKQNPYAKPDTLRIMVNKITNTQYPKYPRKKFYEQ